jgi:hypothetical protein
MSITGASLHHGSKLARHWSSIVQWDISASDAVNEVETSRMKESESRRAQQIMSRWYTAAGFLAGCSTCAGMWPGCVRRSVSPG